MNTLPPSIFAVLDAARSNGFHFRLGAGLLTLGGMQVMQVRQIVTGNECWRQPRAGTGTPC